MLFKVLTVSLNNCTFLKAFLKFRLCFVKLKLLLLAIEVKSDEGNDNKISINPRGTKLPSNTVGFFIAQSAEEVKRWGSVFKSCDVAFSKILNWWKILKRLLLSWDEFINSNNQKLTSERHEHKLSTIFLTSRKYAQGWQKA